MLALWLQVTGDGRIRCSLTSGPPGRRLLPALPPFAACFHHVQVRPPQPKARQPSAAELQSGLASPASGERGRPRTPRAGSAGAAPIRRWPGPAARRSGQGGGPGGGPPRGREPSARPGPRPPVAGSAACCQRCSGPAASQLPPQQGAGAVHMAAMRPGSPWRHALLAGPSSRPRCIPASAERWRCFLLVGRQGAGHVP